MCTLLMIEHILLSCSCTHRMPILFGGARGVLVIAVKKGTWCPDFKGWTRLFAFPIPLGKVCIQLFSLKQQVK